MTQVISSWKNPLNYDDINQYADEVVKRIMNGTFDDGEDQSLVPFEIEESRIIDQQCQVILNRICRDSDNCLVITRRMISHDFGDIEVITWTNLLTFESFTKPVRLLPATKKEMTIDERIMENVFLDEDNPYMDFFVPIVESIFGDELTKMKKLLCLKQNKNESLMEFVWRMKTKACNGKKRFTRELQQILFTIIKCLGYCRCMFMYQKYIEKYRLTFIFSMWLKLSFISSMCSLYPVFEMFAIEACGWKGFKSLNGPSKMELAGFAVNPIVQLLRKRNPDYLNKSFPIYAEMLEPFDQIVPKLNAKNTAMFESMIVDTTLNSILESGNVNQLVDYMMLIMKFIDQHKFTDFTCHTDRCLMFLKTTLRIESLISDCFVQAAIARPYIFTKLPEADLIQNRVIYGIKEQMIKHTYLHN